MKKKAIITGITGQDGAYLAEFLLEKDYEVHGIKRRSSLFNTHRVDHLYRDPHEQDVNFFMHYGDLTDSTNLIRIIHDVQPDEIYNLAAQSHVQVSFDTPGHRKPHRQKLPLFIREAPMPLQNFMPTGSQSTTGKHTIFTDVTEYSSTTKAQSGEKPL